MDINDLTIVLANYGESTCLGGPGRVGWSEGDLAGSGKVDINDLTIVLSSYGATDSSPGSAIAAVPEPSAVTLVVLGAIGLAGILAHRRGRRVARRTDWQSVFRFSLAGKGACRRQRIPASKETGEHGNEAIDHSRHRHRPLRHGVAGKGAQPADRHGVLLRGAAAAAVAGASDARRVLRERFARFRSHAKARLLGDVASFYLPYLEEAIAVEPDIRIVCLKRPREEVVTSFCEWLDQSMPLPTNHWARQPAPGWHHDANRTRTFPQYDTQNREEGIRRYWDEYYRRVGELAARLSRANPDLRHLRGAEHGDRGCGTCWASSGIPAEQQVLERGNAGGPAGGAVEALAAAAGGRQSAGPAALRDPGAVRQLDHSAVRTGAGGTGAAGLSGAAGGRIRGHRPGPQPDVDRRRTTCCWCDDAGLDTRMAFGVGQQAIATDILSAKQILQMPSVFVPANQAKQFRGNIECGQVARDVRRAAGHEAFPLEIQDGHRRFR